MTIFEASERIDGRIFSHFGTPSNSHAHTPVITTSSRYHLIRYPNTHGAPANKVDSYIPSQGVSGMSAKTLLGKVVITLP